MKAPKMDILVSHDIEKTGSRLIGNKVVSVGFVVGTDNCVLETKQFNLLVEWPTIVEGKVTDYGDFEPDCWDRYWSNLPAKIIEECKVDALPQAEGWTLINNFINNLESMVIMGCPDAEHRFSFLSDNSSFDTATIDYNLEKYCNRLPMRYSLTGKYRYVISSDEMFYAMPVDKVKDAKMRIKAVVTADHNPVNDAMVIYLQYLHAKRIMKERDDWAKYCVYKKSMYYVKVAYNWLKNKIIDIDKM
jgi:hypothetical protein